MIDQPLRRHTLVSYGLGSVAPTAAHEFCGAFLLIFYTDLVRLNPIWIGYAFLVRMLIDAVIDPMIGYLSDRTRLAAGRRRPYFLIGSLPGLVFFCLAFMPPIGSETMQFAYLTLVSSLMVVFLSLTEIPHMAMSYEMTPDYDERVRVIGFRNFIESVTSFAAILSVPLVLGFAGQDILDYNLRREDCYRIAAVIIAFVGLATAMASFQGTTESRTSIHECHYDFGEGLRAALRNHAFLILLTITALVVVANRVSVAQLFLLLEHFHGKREEESTGLLTAYFIGCLASIPLWVVFGKRFDKRRMLCVALSVWPLSYCALVAQVWPEHILSGIALAMGASFSGILAMLGAITPEILDADRSQSGCRREGLFASVSNIVWQAGLGVGYLAVGGILQAIGYQGGEAQTRDVVLGLRISTVAFPLAASIGSLAAFSFFPIVKSANPKGEQGRTRPPRKGPSS